ncbi:MAG: Rieske 2Fe-2S domain-containing protein [Planctomycetaceae bacterium]|nr:Rieske 2Fe-2S domain-containing protein [Planctomycetaceae bacterium]
MPAEHRIAAETDIPAGESREFVVAGRIVALFHVEGEFHALDGVCPHAGGPLANGVLEGCIVTCPWHGWQFDVSSGQHCLSAGIRQTAFPVRVADGNIYVELPD